MTPPQRWPFTSYEKIAESLDQLYRDEAATRALEKAQWVVMEKIHGANFCFLTDGKEVRCASRKQMLGPRDDFFGYQAVAARLRQKILDLFTLVPPASPPGNTPPGTAGLRASRVLIYGELFGGSYPHPDVPPDLTVQPIQTGIAYAPSIEFCAFDIAIEDDSQGQPRAYLDYDVATKLLEQAGLFYARPLLIGSFQEALSYPLGFPSTIPKLLGLPPLPTENKAEGVVIKSLKTILLPSGKGMRRPLLKRKIAEFAEDQRFHQAEKWVTPRSTAEQSTLDLLTWEAFNLVTANRLQSAVSKLGALTPGDGKRAQQVFRLLVEDVLEQLGEQHAAPLASLTPAEHAQLLEYIRGEARALMKAYMRGVRG
jgi:Rnl2 family RNA ligase